MSENANQCALLSASPIRLENGRLRSRGWCHQGTSEGGKRGYVLEVMDLPSEEVAMAGCFWAKGSSCHVSVGGNLGYDGQRCVFLQRIQRWDVGAGGREMVR